MRDKFKNGIKITSDIFSWNGFFYGSRKTPKTEKYYKSHNVRFDNTCGGTEEISLDEFITMGKKYYDIMRNNYW